MAETAQPQRSQNALQLRNLTPQKIEQVRANFLKIKVSTFFCFGRPCVNNHLPPSVSRANQESCQLKCMVRSWCSKPKIRFSFFLHRHDVAHFPEKCHAACPSSVVETLSPKIKNKFLFFLQCSAWHIPAGRNDVALLILFLRKIVLDCSIHT